MLDRSVNPLTIGILPGIMSHTVRYLPAGKVILIRITGVLDTAICMNNQLAQVVAPVAGKRFGQAGNLTCCAQIPAAMACQDPAAIHINDKADVVPAATTPH